MHLDVEGAPPERISDATSLAAYRIVQESLTNVRRHASGAEADVSLRFGRSAVSLTVDNHGGAKARPAGGGGVGIAGMRERVLALGGRISAGPHDAGFRVQADLPYEPAS